MSFWPMWTSAGQATNNAAGMAARPKTASATTTLFLGSGFADRFSALTVFLLSMYEAVVRRMLFAGDVAGTASPDR
jgi:hypothetical protein